MDEIDWKFRAPIPTELPELLRKISYKPGWKIKLVEEPNDAYAFWICLIYEGYESENAYFDPVVMEGAKVSETRVVIANSIGQSVRRKQHYQFTKRFDIWTVEKMTPENLVRYLIAETIKQAEMYEFERWFKFDGIPIFEHKEEK